MTSSETDVLGSAELLIDGSLTGTSKKRRCRRVVALIAPSLTAIRCSNGGR